ncbi:bone morphogenetic protein 7-like protein [Dinothrombium tinctorium]|uniref:Bone morphogenetic protein 7-like protein n=1 Tax=Dinothrombium tinctorium TaxID=1965070 RepID=A0A3S3P0J0_9ACAR|nr:bone morphogenetic protein 7-like protein [Dinothrombium tinctorium]
MSLNSVGWEVFYVKEAVLDWIRDHRKNYGLLITVRSLLNEKLEDGILRFAKRHHHHSNKQPILVIFTDDGRKKRPTSFSKLDIRDYGYPELSFKAMLNKVETVTEEKEERSEERRRERSVPSSTEQEKSQQNLNSSLSSTIKSPSSTSQTSCTRHELYVDFAKIGWSTWIISPKGYNAYYCKGDCNFPLGQNQWPTNHATVQSIVHELTLAPGVGKPCCVPNKLFSITLLYFDDQENVVLKQYDDMVAVSCGCH